MAKITYKKTDIENFKVYQLIHRETNQRSHPALSTDIQITTFIGGLALLHPLDVSEEYKNSYVTQNWEHLDLHLILEMEKGKLNYANIHIIKLKDIGRIKKIEKEKVDHGSTKK